MLLVLLAASALVFVIAVLERREPDSRAHGAARIGARGARRARRERRRRCAARCWPKACCCAARGAVLGVAHRAADGRVLARYASRFSVRALDLTLDASILWVGVGLALVAAVLLAFVPRLPSGDRPARLAAVERRPAHHRRDQPAAARVCGHADRARRSCCWPAPACCCRRCLTLQAARPGFETAARAGGQRAGDVVRADAGADARVLPRAAARVSAAARRRTCRVRQHRAVARCRGGRARLAFSVEGAGRARTARTIRARGSARCRRASSPRSGIPLVAGRDFTDADRDGAERVVIVSAEHRASSCFPGRILNRHLMWTDGVMKFIGVSTEPRRIVGVVGDIDDERDRSGAR